MTLRRLPRAACHRDAPLCLAPSERDFTTTDRPCIPPSVSLRETGRPWPSRFRRQLKPTIPPAATSHSP